MVAVKEEVLDLDVTDFSGQHRLAVRGVATDSAVGDLVSASVQRLGLTSVDPNGVPYVYQARHERLGQHVHAADRVGDVFESGDTVSLAPEVHAGGTRMTRNAVA